MYLLISKLSCLGAEGLMRKCRNANTWSLSASALLAPSPQWPGLEPLPLKLTCYQRTMRNKWSKKNNGTEYARRKKKCEDKKTKQGLSYGREHSGSSLSALQEGPVSTRSSPHPQSSPTANPHHPGLHPSSEISVFLLPNPSWQCCLIP